MNSIGQRLRHVRADHSQSQMADELGIGLRTYASYERDEREPEVKTIIRMVELGWNGNWLLTGKGPERLNATPDDPDDGAPISPKLDQALLARAIAGVRGILARNAVQVTSAVEAELVGILYEMFVQGMALEAAEQMANRLLNVVTTSLDKAPQTAG